MRMSVSELERFSVMYSTSKSPVVMSEYATPSLSPTFAMQMMKLFFALSSISSSVIVPAVTTRETYLFIMPFSPGLSSACSQIATFLPMLTSFER